ncbi:MAG: ABC transporter ATP-binding protein [Calditrichaeota bacterium]|nr:ABC transporter ATP-binding protein [Calditrichota bacterium]
MIDLQNVGKIYHANGKKVAALDDLSLRIEKGEFVVIRGPSGSGKTTLLLTIGAMLKPDSGEVAVAGENIYSLKGGERAKFRAANIGFVFQMFHLLPYLTVWENIMVPALENQKSEAHEILEDLGLAERAHHKPFALSAGERQRTAVARALINHPKVILADEPTGNLDPENASDVIEHLAGFHAQGGTVVVVTHSEQADVYATRIIRMRKGKINV